MTKPMVIIEPAGMKNQDDGEIWHIRLGFETVSWQLVAHIQKRFYSIHAEPFSRTPKSSKQKKGSASRVNGSTSDSNNALVICSPHPPTPGDSGDIWGNY